jgi:HAD superfamily hydrolase (TIGR01509 family)
MTTPVEAVIFDCDGTLVDSVTLATEVLVEYLADLGHAVPASGVGERFACGRLSELLVDLERTLGRALPDDFVAELRRRRDEAMRARLRPIDGARELVAGLTVPMAVASNGPRDQTTLSLALTGLLPFFPARVFSAYDVGSWKPEPGLLLHVATQLGVEPARCLVVEDAAPGVDAALAAGMRVLVLCESRWPSDLVREIRHLSEVRDHVPAYRPGPPNG